MMLFGAVRLRVVCAVFSKLFVPSERARASTLGYKERIKDLSCSELFGLELFRQPDMRCSCTLGELKPLHKELVCLFCVIFYVALIPVEIYHYVSKLFVKQPVIYAYVVTTILVRIPYI